MDHIFSSIAEEVRGGQGRVIATHNAVVDLVYSLPLKREEFAKGIVSGEQRFEGDFQKRLGGCGINFALAAAAVGHPYVHFAGFLDQQVVEQLMALSCAGEARIKLEYIMQTVRQNVIVELQDGNMVLKEAEQQEQNLVLISQKLRALEPGSSDWVASCSFRCDVTPLVFEHGENLFLDSGYGQARRAKKMITSLLEFLKQRTRPIREFIIAANETEILNLCSECGICIHSDLPSLAQQLADYVSQVIGHKTKVLLHTSTFSTCIGPGEEKCIVPSLDIVPVRRTNAGDTYGGAFMAAYSVTHDAQKSCFFATAAVAKRLAQDELPTPERTREFLKTARSRTLAFSSWAERPREAPGSRCAAL